MRLPSWGTGLRALLVACIPVLSTACALPVPQPAGIARLSSEEAVQLHRKGLIRLVDTRSASERSGREIPNTLAIQFGPDRWAGRLTEDDVQRFIRHVEASGLTKHDAIVTVCNAGVRSDAAAQALRAAGYTSAKAMAGGYIGTEHDLGWQFYQD